MAFRSNHTKLNLNGYVFLTKKLKNLMVPRFGNVATKNAYSSSSLATNRVEFGIMFDIDGVN